MKLSTILYAWNEEVNEIKIFELIGYDQLEDKLIWKAGRNRLVRVSFPGQSGVVVTLHDEN